MLEFKHVMRTMQSVRDMFFCVCIWLFMQLVFGIIFFQIGKICNKKGTVWLYGSLAVFLVLLFVFMQCVLKVREQVYDRRELGIWLTMPISHWNIVKKRILHCFLQSKWVSSVILCPAVIAGIELKVWRSAGQIIRLVVLSNLIQILIIVGLAFFYGLIYLIIRGKLFHLIFSFLMLGGIYAYFELFLHVQHSLTADTVRQARGDWAGKLLQVVGSVIEENRLWSLFSLGIFTFLLIFLFSRFINRFYLQIVSDYASERRTKAHMWKRRTTNRALLGRYFLFYMTDIRNYLRAGGVTLIMLVFALLQFWERGKLLEILEGAEPGFDFLVVYSIVFAYNIMIAYSVDLLENEYRFSWMNMSFPISEAKQRGVCVIFHNLMTLPFNFVLCLSMSMFQTHSFIMLFFLSTEFTLLISVFGLVFFDYSHKKKRKYSLNSHFLTKEYGFIACFAMLGIMIFLSQKCGLSELESTGMMSILLLILDVVSIHRFVLRKERSECQ